MPEEPKRYTIKEIQHFFEHLDPQGDEIEAMLELNVKVTFLLYQAVDPDTGKSQRAFTARFYHEDPDEDDQSGGYAAEIQDVDNGVEGMNREISFDEVTDLLQIDPDKPLWELTVEPEALESGDQ